MKKVVPFQWTELPSAFVLLLNVAGNTMHLNSAAGEREQRTVELMHMFDKDK